MNNFYCAGIDHHRTDVELRERFSISEKRLPEALDTMRQIEGARECFVLSTCNRVELYARGDETLARTLPRFLSSFHGIDESELNCHRYLFQGEDVARHLFKVASGLESMVVGEYEIYGQLKRAFKAAIDAGTVDSVLFQLIERALRVGKRARTETNISKGAVSVSSVAVELAEKIFGHLHGEQVLVIGTGEMSELTLQHLVKAGAGKIIVTSRSFEKALGIAQKFGAEPIAFDEWLRALRTSDIVISSTAAPHAIIKADDVKSVMQERRRKPLFFIDIAVPRDVESAVQHIDDVYLYNIDDLQSVIHTNVRERKREIEKCEKIIDHEIEEFHGWIEQLDLKPTLAWFQNYFDEVVRDEIEKSRTKFSGKEDELENLLTRVRKKLFHRPLKNLKRASHDGSLHRYLQIVRELFSDHVYKSDKTSEFEKKENSHA